MPAQATATQTERVPIDELVIVPFEGFPAPIAQVLAGDLAARGISTRVDASLRLPDAAYSATG